MGEKNEELQILIITGLSGAGKTQAINCLEDLGYYCVDNLPPALMLKFIELSMQSAGIKKVALVIDVRGGDFFPHLSLVLEELEDGQANYQIVFLEASDEVLVRRFKESRRRHPLGSSSRLLEAIQEERKILQELRGKAHFLIDTSSLSPRELKEKLDLRYSENESLRFSAGIISFGYKLGLPMDSDLVIDVRFLPNPFYIPHMRSMTGKDPDVMEYVLESSVTKSFTRRFLNLLKYLIPYYIKEGKSNLAIAIGCTGGQHRSVVLADYTGKQLEKLGYNVIVRHRDMAKRKMEG